MYQDNRKRLIKVDFKTNREYDYGFLPERDIALQTENMIMVFCPSAILRCKRAVISMIKNMAYIPVSVHVTDIIRRIFDYPPKGKSV